MSGYVWSSFKGRTSRGHFWLLSVVVWLVFYLLSGLVRADAGAIAVGLINLPLLALLLGVCARRMHDLNRSGWWLLTVLIPVAGALWLVWQLGFKSGVASVNRWGHSPSHAAGDFLTVQ